MKIFLDSNLYSRKGGLFVSSRQKASPIYVESLYSEKESAVLQSEHCIA
jgi:hypothetical protein